MHTKQREVFPHSPHKKALAEVLEEDTFPRFQTRRAENKDA